MTREDIAQALNQAVEQGNFEVASNLADVLDYMENKPQADTQRLRTAAQGLTFGYGDEIEAGVRALSGADYKETLGDVRGKINDYKDAYPIESTAYEVGGALVPAIATAPFTMGASVPATLGRIAAIGATEGALYGSGIATEGERLEGAGQGALFGAGLGLAGYGVGTLAGKFMRHSREKLGGIKTDAVQREIDRIVADTNSTPDEVIARIQKGEVLAENPVINELVRSFRSYGGESGAIIKNALDERPDRLAKEAMTSIKGALSDNTEESALKAFRQSDDAARANESKLYDKAFAQAEVLDDEIVMELGQIFKRIPGSAKKVDAIYRAKTGQPLFKEVTEDGEVVFNQHPTLEDAEIVRRVLREISGKSWKDGNGTLGEAVGSLESSLKSHLDDFSPDLSNARQAAKSLRQDRDAFKLGRSQFGKDTNEVALQFEDTMKLGSNPLAAYREGILSGIEAKNTTGSRKSLMGNLADESRREGGALRIVMPEDNQSLVLDKIELASNSQKAKNAINGGSQTSGTTMQGEKVGLSGIKTVATDLMDNNWSQAIRSTASMIRSKTTGLTDAQRTEVAKILVSENPDMVKKAMDGTLTGSQTRTLIENGLKKAGFASGFASGGVLTERDVMGVLAQ
jgi:hypothetical protein